MSEPRMVHPGVTYHITRTTNGRAYLLKPSPIVNRVIRYCLFRAAAKYGMQVHWVVVESNHFHAGVTDVRGEISLFMAWLDGMVAKNLIAHYEQTHPDKYIDSIWSKDHFNAVVLGNAEAVMQAMVYDLTNPVKDGLVNDYRQWPGLVSRPGDWLKPVDKVRRVDGLYFSAKDKVHRDIDVQYVVPPMLLDRHPRKLVDSMHALISDKMKAARAQMKLDKRTFLGSKAVLAVDPFDSPNTPRVKGKRAPTFASGGDHELLQEGIKLVRNFLQRYRQAWKQYRDGVLNALFPSGTYLMRVRHHATCDTMQPPWCTAAA